MKNMLVKCKVCQANHRLTDIMTCGAAVTALNRIAVSCSHADMFPLNSKVVNTREHEKYYVQPAYTDRLRKSAIPYMQRLLNKKNQ